MTKMDTLKYISDKDFENAVIKLIETTKKGLRKIESKFDRNVIDPFSIYFEMFCLEIPTLEAWQENEKARQAQKIIVQALGDFHQEILGSVSGWENLHVGQDVDLVNHDRKIIAEVKNKHNTVTGGKLSGVYEDLYQLVMQNSSKYKGYTAYFVHILPDRPEGYDKEFIPSDRKISDKKPSNSLIRVIDGAKFYELVTGDKNALKKVHNKLPNVLKKITNIDISTKNILSISEYFDKAYKI